jgi:addiction module HigA family antidote
MRSGSWIITDEEIAMVENEFAPVTPGEMLKEEFLAEYELPQNQLAKAVGVSPNRITEIVNNRRRITADTALRFALYFGNSPEFWLNLQTHYDLKLAERKLKPQIAKRIEAQRAACTLLPKGSNHCIRVEFIDENGGGPGVRLRKPPKQKR